MQNRTENQTPKTTPNVQKPTKNAKTNQNPKTKHQNAFQTSKNFKTCKNEPTTKNQTPKTSSNLQSLSKTGKKNVPKRTKSQQPNTKKHSKRSKTFKSQQENLQK